MQNIPTSSSIPGAMPTTEKLSTIPFTNSPECCDVHGCYTVEIPDYPWNIAIIFRSEMSQIDTEKSDDTFFIRIMPDETLEGVHLDRQFLNETGDKRGKRHVPILELVIAPDNPNIPSFAKRFELPGDSFH